MRVKYIPVFTENINEQIDFFTGRLGFTVSEKKIIYEDAECKVIEAGGSNIFFVLIEKSVSPDAKNCIILNTDDCLNDYYMLKTNGVVFFNEPQYMPIGLAANFMDTCGNRFLLLEERNYNE